MKQPLCVIGELPAEVMIQIQKREAAAAEAAKPNMDPKDMRIRDLLKPREIPAPAIIQPDNIKSAAAKVAALLATKK